VGIAVKPAVGMFDFASRTTEGIKNQTRSDILSMNAQVMTLLLLLQAWTTTYTLAADFVGGCCVCARPFTSYRRWASRAAGAACVCPASSGRTESCASTMHR
jgi:hypothetical protein